MRCHGVCLLMILQFWYLIENLEVNNRLDKWRLPLERKKLKISRSKIEYEFCGKRPRGLTRLGEQ